MDEQTACTQDYPAVHSGEYREGEARAVHLGEIELKDGRVFNGVILEFPAGPPALPISVIWNGTPLTLSIKVSP